jgi:hypothetical protein
LFLLNIALLVSAEALAVDQISDKSAFIYKSPVITYEVKRLPSGDVKLIAKENGKVTHQMDRTTMSKLSDSLIEIAKQVCSYKLIPDTVTVSLPIISATWDTKKLCKYRPV